MSTVGIPEGTIITDHDPCWCVWYQRGHETELAQKCEWCKDKEQADKTRKRGWLGQ